MIARQLAQLTSFKSVFGGFKFCSTIDGSEQATRFPKQQLPKFKKAAMVLSGCGVFDGSEVTEVVSLMVHLNKMYVDVQFFAPNEDQMHVINHATGETTTEKRNALVEAARITRGKVRDIKELKGEDFQAILIPGGFGVAKNLSDYAVNGGSFSVHVEVERVIKEFHALQKPIGAMCISPILLAKVLADSKPKITLGGVSHEGSEHNYWPHSDAIQVAESLGAMTVHRKADQFQIDFENKIVTTPAFMFDGFTKYGSAYEGIGTLCKIIEQIVLDNPINVESFLSKDRQNATSNYSSNNNYSNNTEDNTYQQRRRRSYDNNNSSNDGEQSTYRRRPYQKRSSENDNQY